MFKVSFMVEDKNLPPVLHGVANLVLNLEVLSATNVKKGKPGKAVTVTANGTASELIRKFISDNHLAEVTTQDVMKIGASLGKTEAASTQAIIKLQKDKFLKRAAKALYKVSKG